MDERELEEKAAQAFELPSDNAIDLKKVESENKRLLQKVGQLTIDCVFYYCLRGCRTQSEIIEMESHRPAGLCRNRFCKYKMKLNRSTLYYQPKGESEENLEMMRIIDEYHPKHPTSGVCTYA